MAFSTTLIIGLGGVGSSIVEQIYKKRITMEDTVTVIYFTEVTD